MSGINEVFNKMKEDMEIPEIVEEKAEQAFAKILLLTTEQKETISGKTCRQETQRRKKEKKKKIIVVSLIAATFCMTAAVAAVGFHLPDIFQREFDSEEVMEEIQMDIPVEISGQKYVPVGLDEAAKKIFNSRPIIDDPSALLEIKETLYDGMSLYVYCEATENGKKYELGGDRIYVDGIEIEGGVVTDDEGKRM